MTKAEFRKFLRAGTSTEKLATVRAYGRPHVTPVWFELDGDDLVFTTWHKSKKGLNMRRDPRVSLCVDEEAPLIEFVLVEGTLTFVESKDQRAYWTRRIAAWYMGEDLADAYGERNNVEGELDVRLLPTKVIARKDIAGW